MTCDFAQIVLESIIIALCLGVVIELAVIAFQHPDNDDDK